MQSALTFRTYQNADAPYLAQIIRKTWQYDRFCSPKTAQRMARLYLLSCLAGQTFNQVAVLDGVPVGVIMGRDKRQKPSRRFSLRLAGAELAMLGSKEGRAVSKAFANIDAVDDDLLRGRGREYEGELRFFAVAGQCRGTGIGKALFTRLTAYMEAQGIPRFYLYTDSSCNYGFYERQGMTRCGERTYSVPIGVENQMQFYLYEYEKTCI